MSRLTWRLEVRTVIGVISRASPTILLAFILVLSISPAAVAECDISPKGNIQMIAESGPVQLASDYSLDQISKLAHDTGNAGKGTRLGFYVGRFMYKISVILEARTDTTCTRHIRVEVDMQLVDRHIEIGQELREKRCLFSAALRHYQKKAKADEAVFAQYVNSTAIALRGTPVPAIGVPRDQPLDDASRAQIEEWAKLLVDQSLSPLHAARVAAQQAVDTPEEMKQLTQACTKDA
jgi:hypothetical protein